MSATLAVPESLAVAVAEMHKQLAELEAVQIKYVSITQLLTAHDAMSSRVRIAAIDNLIKRGMTKTDATNSARLDPDYAEHGDRLTELQNKKAAAEGELNTVKARLEVAIATVRAFTFGYGEIGS
jgi:hypothetical protein